MSARFADTYIVKLYFPHHHNSPILSVRKGCDYWIISVFTKFNLSEMPLILYVFIVLHVI